MTMPVLPYDEIKNKLTEDQFELVKGIFGRNNRLRSSKPTGDGRTKYIWRMVAFYISTNSIHHCMPVMADFDIPVEVYEHYPEKYNFQKCGSYIKDELNPIIDIIVASMPSDQLHGLARWARALSKY